MTITDTNLLTGHGNPWGTMANWGHSQPDIVKRNWRYNGDDGWMGSKGRRRSTSQAMMYNKLSRMYQLFHRSTRNAENNNRNYVRGEEVSDNWTRLGRDSKWTLYDVWIGNNDAWIMAQINIAITGGHQIMWVTAGTVLKRWLRWG